jgi:hypothetical protein
MKHCKCSAYAAIRDMHTHTIPVHARVTTQPSAKRARKNASTANAVRKKVEQTVEVAMGHVEPEPGRFDAARKEEMTGREQYPLIQG